MFFVISGYLITSIILEQKKTNSFKFYTFYEKRVKRIVPAYFFLLLVIPVIGYFNYFHHDLMTLKRTIQYSAVFISNVLFSEGGSYFGAKLSENPLLHTWSLSIEMQFYLLLPIFLIFIKNKYLPKVIISIFVLLTIYSSYEMLINNNKPSIYFSLLSRIPEFLIGSLFGLFNNTFKFTRIQNTGLAVISIVGLLASAIFINENSPFPGFLAIIPCMATGILLVVRNNVISNIFSNRILVYIGELSYSLYLWHWPIMAVLRYNNDSYYFNFKEVVIITIFTGVLSWVSYTYIENVFRRKSDFTFIKILVPLSCIVCIFNFSLLKLPTRIDLPEKYIKPTFGLDSHFNGIVEIFGNKNSVNNKILLIGDSHAMVIKPFLDYIGSRNDFSFKTISCDSYPAIEGIKEDEIPDEELYFYRNSIKLINITKKNIDNNNIILINSIGFERAPSLVTSLDKLTAGLKKEQKLILFNTYPTLDRNPIKVNKSFIKKTSNVIKIKNNLENEKILKMLANKYDNVFYYDLSKSNVFKDIPFYKDTLMYYDANHLNIYGSRSLAKDLEKDFMSFFKPILDNTK